jgi:hypothetical protein
MRLFRGTGQVKVPVSERWWQVFRIGEVELHHFTATELAAVSLQREAMPPQQAPFLRAVTQLPGDPSGPAPTAGTIAGLERQGFVRPWPPAEPEPGPNPIQEEYPGWAASPDTERRPVALAGDLAIITSTRSMPAWIGEMSFAADPTRPSPDNATWQLAARVYARFHVPSGLVEHPAGPDGTTVPYVLLRNDKVVYLLVEWCGPTMSAADEQTPAEEADTASLAPGFRRLAQVQLALPHQDQVLMRTVIVASTDDKYWLLDGQYWERAIRTSTDDLGQRITEMINSAMTAD